MNFYVWCAIIAVILFIIACCTQKIAHDESVANFILSIALIVGLGLPLIRLIYKKVTEAQKEEEERQRREENAQKEEKERKRREEEEQNRKRREENAFKLAKN